MLYFLKQICHAELEEKLVPNFEEKEAPERETQVAEKENSEVVK